MKEKYYKVHKTFAARAGLTAQLRKEVDNDYLMLSEKDVRMISLSVEERLEYLQTQEPEPETETDETETAPEESTEESGEETETTEENNDTEAGEEENNNEDNGEEEQE